MNVRMKYEIRTFISLSECPIATRETCFQKAELARQLDDWDQVLFLAEESRSINFQPHYGIEYTTFIEAYISNGNWEEAASLSMYAYPVRMYGADDLLCQNWRDYKTEYGGDTNFDAVYEQLSERMTCLSE